MEKFANEVSANLDGAVNNSVTSLTVKNVVGTVPPSGTFRARVESEYVKVTGVSGLVWTVARGDGGTTAASHADNVPVYAVVTKEALDSIVTVQSAGTEVSNRRVLNITGATVTDDSGNARTNIVIPAAPSFESAWTVPALSDYTWVNQGSATADDSDGKGIFLTTPAASQNNMKLLVIPTGSPPWSYVGKLIPANLNVSTPICGFLFCVGTAGGFMHSLRFNASGNVIDGIEWNSPTSFSNTDFSFAKDPFTPFTWVKVANNSTNISFSVSIDGTHWLALKSDYGLTRFGDPFDHVGFYVEAPTATWPGSAKLVSAKLN